MYRLLLVALMALGLCLIFLTAPAVAEEAGDPEAGSPKKCAGPPVVEAPKAPQVGSAVADGGGMNNTHTAWTTGSGPGNDVGFDRSTLSNSNTVEATIIDNWTFLKADEGGYASEAILSNMNDLNGQFSFSQNAGNSSAVGAGTSLSFINNQGETNPALILGSAVLTTIEIVKRADEVSAENTGTYYGTAAPGIQTAVGDGNASASGGGSYVEHTAWTTGSGTGNDVGFSRSSLLSANLLVGAVTGNRVIVCSDAAIRQAAIIGNFTAANGQFAMAQNTGNNSVTGAGTSVNFVSNVTSYPD